MRSQPLDQDSPDRQNKIITKVYGGGRTQIPEKVREKLDLRDDDYVVWFNDYAGRWWIGKGKIQISSMRDLHSRKLSPNERKAYWEWKQRRIKDHSILGL